jgi:hypothetical protein
MMINSGREARKYIRYTLQNFQRRARKTQTHQFETITNINNNKKGNILQDIIQLNRKFLLFYLLLRNVKCKLC